VEIDVVMITSSQHTQFKDGPKLGQLFHWFTFLFLSFNTTKISQI
jgi:hypothetical protein